MHNILLLVYLFQILVVNQSLINQYWFHPLKMLNVSNVIFVFIPALWIVNFSNNSNFYYTYSEHYNETIITFMIFHAVFNLIGLVINKVNFKTIGFSYDLDIRPVVIGLYIISILCKIYMFMNGRYFLDDKYGATELSEIPSIIVFFNNIHLLAFSIYSIYYFRITRSFRKDKNLYIFLIIILSISILDALLVGRRFGAVYPLLILFFLKTYWDGVDRKKVITYVISVVVFFILVSIVRYSQANLLESGYTPEDIEMALVIDSIDSNLLSTVSDALVSRVGNPFIIANIVINNLSNNGINTNHDVFLHLFESLIPRVLIENKSAVSIGNQFGQELKLINYNNNLTRINPGWVGESLYSGGLAYVVFLAILLSFMIILTYKLFDNNSDLGMIVKNQLFLLVFSGFQMETAYSFNNSFKSILFSFILMLFLNLAYMFMRRVSK